MTITKIQIYCKQLKYNNYYVYFIHITNQYINNYTQFAIYIKYNYRIYSYLTEILFIMLHVFINNLQIILHKFTLFC